MSPALDRNRYRIQPRVATCVQYEPNLKVWGRVMNEGWFTRPVSMTVGLTGEAHNVSSARQAMIILDHHWPGEHGEIPRSPPSLPHVHLAGMQLTGSICV